MTEEKVEKDRNLSLWLSQHLFLLFPFSSLQLFLIFLRFSFALPIPLQNIILKFSAAPFSKEQLWHHHEKLANPTHSLLPMTLTKSIPLTNHYLFEHPNPFSVSQPSHSFPWDAVDPECPLVFSGFRSHFHFLLSFFPFALLDCVTCREPQRKAREEKRNDKEARWITFCQANRKFQI